MFSLIITIISIALVVGVTGATMYYISGTGDSEAILAAAELLTQSEQIAVAIDMRAFQEKGELADLDALVTGKYLMQVPLPPEYAFVSGESSVLDWQVPQANPRPVVLVSNKIKASVCSAFNNKMLSDASIPAKANPALRIQCFGAAEPYSVVINPSMNPDQLEAVLPADTGTTTPEPDAQLPVPQTVALESANLCFKQGVYGSFDFKTVFSASQETNPTVADVLWSASGILPAGLSFDTATGVISGTPTEQASSDYAVTASYKNAQGQQVYKLLVKGSELEALQISAGENYSCAITINKKVVCWGRNDYGQLGDGTYAMRSTPVYVEGLSEEVTSISTQKHHTCAVHLSGDASCWGRNDYAQLGDGSLVSNPRPQPVTSIPDGVKDINILSLSTCALTNSGGVKCWGRNFTGNLGNNTTIDSAIPVDVQGLQGGVIQLASGTGHSCALVEGFVKCWGSGWGAN